MAKTKLTPADEKFIAKFLNSNKELDFDAKTIIRRNRFTGATFEVDPITAACIDFVFKIEPILYDAAALRLVHPDLKPTNSISNFDRARMIVAKLDNTAYMGILD